MSYPSLQKGDEGRAVNALQRLLRAANVRPGEPTGEFDSYTRRQVQAFQAKHRLAQDGVVGKKTWEALAYRLERDAYARWLLNHAPPPQSAASDVRDLIVKSAWYGYHNAYSLHYAQIRPMPHYWHLPMYTDCSGFATLCYQVAGAPDPNGFAYNGAGNTSTLIAHGRVTPLGSIKPGDLIFYSNPEHVVVYVGAGKVISNGSEGGPYFVGMTYRSISHVRSYL